MIGAGHKTGNINYTFTKDSKWACDPCGIGWGEASSLQRITFDFKYPKNQVRFLCVGLTQNDILSIC
jgi:hypothetical protein